MPSPVLARRLITPFRSKLLAEYAVNGFFGGITSARATVSPMYRDASGDLVQYAANNVALVNGDSVACWPGFTNLMSRSEELDDAAWTNYNSTAITPDTAVAPDGTTTAYTIDADSAVSEQLLEQTFLTGSAGFAGSDRHCISLFVKKTSGAVSHYPALVFLYGGGTAFQRRAVFDTTNGTVTADNCENSGVIDCGDYWRFWAVHYDENGDNTYIRARIYPALNADGSTSNDASATGSIVAWGAQATQSSYLLPYVPTAGSSVAVDASEPVVPWPSGLVNDFVVKFDWWADRIKTDNKILHWGGDGSGGYSQVYWSGTRVRFRRRMSSTNYDAASIGALATGEWHEIIVRMSAQQGSAIWVDETKGSEISTNTLDIVDNGSLALGNDLDSPATLWAESSRFKNLRIIKVGPNISDAEVLAL